MAESYNGLVRGGLANRGGWRGVERFCGTKLDLEVPMSILEVGAVKVQL